MSKEFSNELTEKQQENKKEDRKAIVKFVIILGIAFLIGIAVGIGGVILKDILETSSFKEALVVSLQILAIYGGYAFTTILLLACIVLYKKSRKEYIAWDEEDEDVLCRMETKLSYVLWFSNLILYGAYLFFSTGVWATELSDAKSAAGQGVAGFLSSLAIVFLHMIYALLVACVVQQKAVNMMKEINPEKAGSVYDIKFQDKWLENCDEAERYATYKCSYKTFKTMQTVGIVFWLICLLGQMFFDTGVFATVVVTIYLIIQTSVYSVQGIYFAKHPSEVMK